MTETPERCSCCGEPADNQDGYDRGELPERYSYFRERILAETPRAAELEERLLWLGGYRVVFMRDGLYLEGLLGRGRAFPGKGSKLRKMRASRCHQNAATLWLESRGRISIMTGYALSDDGLWRQYSWGLGRGKIIETTERREAYYGITLSRVASLQFACGNPPQDLEEVYRNGGGGELPARILARLTGDPYEEVMGLIRGEKAAAVS